MNPETYVSLKILKESKKALKNGTEDTEDIHENDMVLEITFAFFGANFIIIINKTCFNLLYFLCRSLVETADKDVLNIVDELKDIEVEKAHKQEEVLRCGESRSSCVKILLKGIVATYDTAT